MILIGTILTTIGIMVAMDQYTSHKIERSHRRTMELLDAFRIA